jgi:hypothetical protein
MPNTLIKMDKAWFIQSHTGNIKDCYYFEKKLGAGGYGAVYLAKNKLTGNNHSHLCALLYIHNFLTRTSRCESRSKGDVERKN